MIFYHYTLIANLGSIDGSEPGIVRDGLLPHQWNEHFAHLPKKVVGLTTQAEGVPSWWRNQDPENLKAYCRIRSRYR
jgi:hypothetical protein